MKPIQIFATDLLQNPGFKFHKGEGSPRILVEPPCVAAAATQSPSHFGQAMMRKVLQLLWSCIHVDALQQLQRHPGSARAAIFMSWSSFSADSAAPEPTKAFAIEDSPLLKQIGTTSISLTLKQHRPMGCTVEQSLADEDILLVSSLVEGGHAATAGLRVGDVVVGITGTFGTIVGTEGMPIGTLRTLVTSRPDNEVLQLDIVRGSSALADHERVLTDLCTNPDTSDDQVEQVVTSILQQGYGRDESDDQTVVACDDEENCLLDDMHNMWAEELDLSDGSQEDSTDTTEETPKIKPWSVRSSPSGTFVRDPSTGEMKNVS